MFEITRELFDHLVDLAALELTDQEAKYLHTEMNQQLKAIHELDAIPLDSNVKITSHGIQFSEEDSLLLREDRIIYSNCITEIVEQVPEFENGYVIVPDIEHITLE